MKVIISEQRINNVIEKLLMNNIDGIKSVDFIEKNVSAFDKGKPTNYKKTSIQIVVDPGNVCGGNLYFSEGVGNLKLRRKIHELLNDTLSIDVRQFMSRYDIVIYEVVTNLI